MATGKFNKDEVRTRCTEVVASIKKDRAELKAQLINDEIERRTKHNKSFWGLFKKYSIDPTKVESDLASERWNFVWMAMKYIATEQEGLCEKIVKLCDNTPGPEIELSVHDVHYIYK